MLLATGHVSLLLVDFPYIMWKEKANSHIPTFSKNACSPWIQIEK